MATQVHGKVQASAGVLLPLVLSAAPFYLFLLIGIESEAVRGIAVVEYYQVDSAPMYLAYQLRGERNAVHANQLAQAPEGNTPRSFIWGANNHAVGGVF